LAVLRNLSETASDTANKMALTLDVIKLMLSKKTPSAGEFTRKVNRKARRKQPSTCSGRAWLLN
jgi:hypothetical protein